MPDLKHNLYVQLMMPAESAHDTIAALGEVGLLQFKDLNPDKSAFQRTFANQVPIHKMSHANFSIYTTLYTLGSQRSILRPRKTSALLHMCFELCTCN